MQGTGTKSGHVWRTPGHTGRQVALSARRLEAPPGPLVRPASHGQWGDFRALSRGVVKTNLGVRTHSGNNIIELEGWLG